MENYLKKILFTTFGLFILLGMGGTKASAVGISHRDCIPTCNDMYVSLNTAVAQDSSGNMYIADYYMGLVVKVNTSGSQVLSFDGATNGNTAFGGAGVQDMLVYNDTIFIVSRNAPAQIELFDTNGNFLRAIGSGVIASETYIDVYNGKLYAMSNNQGVHVFDITTGNHETTLGTAGTLAGQIYNGGIALDSSGNIYIANRTPYKLVKLTNAGVFVDEWLSADYVEDYVLRNPGAIDIDSSNNIYIGTTSTSYGDNRVEVFDTDGNLQSKIIVSGTSQGQLSSSPYLKVYGNSLYVSDSNSNNYGVKVFDLSGNYQDIYTPNVHVDTPDAFARIQGINMDSSGNIYVAEGLVGSLSYSRVRVYDPDLNLVRTIGTQGFGAGELYNTGGVEIDASGNVYVASAATNKVVVYNSTGVFQYEFGTAGSADGQLGDTISDIKLDGSGNIYVVDTENNRIQKFTTAGVYVSKFGTFGSGNGQFAYPSAIDIDSAGNIYVVDAENYRIQKFNSSETYVSQWGTEGSGDGEFETDMDWSDIFIDDSDNIYVADTWNHRIQVFDTAGNYLYEWGSGGGIPGLYYAVSAIYVTPDLKVFSGDVKTHYLTVSQLTNYITSLPAGLTVEDADGYNLATDGGYGSSIAASIKASGYLLSEVVVDLTADRDWSSISGQVDPVNGKAFISNVPGAPGTASSHAFYIGIPSGKTSSKAVLCPNATSISESSVSCAGGVQFSEGETKTVGSDSVTVTKVTTGGKSYWKANGLSNKMGGAVVIDVTPTPDPVPEENPAEDTTGDTDEPTTYINLGSGSAEGDYLTITEQTEEYGEGEVEVCWETNKESKGKVEYGVYNEEEMEYTEEILVEEYGLSHCVTLTALDEEESEYQYKITAETEDGELTEIERQITIYPVEEEKEEVVIEVLDVDVETEGTYENGSDTRVKYETTYNALCRVDYGYQEDGLTRTYSSDVKGVAHTAYLVTADFPEGTDVYGMINCDVDVPGEDVPRQVTKALFIARDSLKEQVTYEEEESWIPGAVGIGLAAVSAVLGGAMIAVYPNSVGYAFGWLRNKKKRRPWGLVYDRGENKPVAFAVVELYKGEQFVQKVVTDLEGRYMLPVDPGSYRVVAKQSGYEEAVEEINVTEPRSANLDIGLTKDGNASMIYTLRKVLPKINRVIFTVGFLISLVITVLYFNWINLAVLIFYTIQIVTWFMMKSPRGTGFVYQSGTGKKVKGAIVKVHDAKDLGVEDSQMTNEEGRYGFLLKDGEYRLSVSGRGHEIDEEEARRSMQVEKQGEEVYLVAQIMKGDFVDIAIPVKPSQKASGFTQ